LRRAERGDSMGRAKSQPNLTKKDPDDLGELGDFHIRRKIQRSKEKLKAHKSQLDETLRMSQSLSTAGFSSTNGWLRRPDQLWNTPGITIDSDPNKPTKFVGQGANELSKWMNAESITRYKEETNLAVPTLRQIMKIDDVIGIQQMTKSQLCALPTDPTLNERGPRWDVNAKHRHLSSYRSGRIS